MGIKPYEAGSRAGAGLSGMLILQPNSKLKMWKASYTKGTTLIRVWGNTSADENGNITMLPHRDNDGNFGTSFFVQDAVCEGWGKDSRFSFMTGVEDEDNWPAGSPADLFYTEVSNHPDFKWLTERPSANDFAPISAPVVNGFLKGLLLECGGKDYKADPLWGVILRVSKSAKEAFETLIDTENPSPVASNDPNDPNGWYAKYLVGDPTGFAEGKIFEFNKESAFKSTGPDTEINLEGHGGGNTSKGSGGGKGFEKYACRMWPTKPKLPLPEKKVHANNETYEEALRYLTGVEQITQVLIPGFGRSCKDALVYVFGGKDVLPASFEFAKKTVDMAPKAGAVQSPSTQGAAVPPAAVSVPAAAAPAATEVPQVGAVTPPQAEVEINLGVSTDQDPAYTPDPSTPVEVAAQVTTSAPEGPENVAPGTTTNDLRSRLAAAQSNQQQ